MPFELSRRNHVTMTLFLRHEIDGEKLREALKITEGIFPFVKYGIVKQDGKYYFVDGQADIPLTHSDRVVRPNSLSADGPLLTVGYQDRRIFVAICHCLFDSKGAETFFETLVYHYYRLSTGKTPKLPGVITCREEVPAGIFADAVYRIEDADPDADFNVYYDKTYELPYVQTEPVDIGTVGRVRLDSAEFLAFARANGATPTAALLLLYSRALMDLYPDESDGAVISTEIIADIRNAMGVPATMKNTLYAPRVVLPRKALAEQPMRENAAAVRAMLKRQTEKGGLVQAHFHPPALVPYTYMLSYIYRRSPLELLDGFVDGFEMTESGTRKIDYFDFGGVFGVNTLFDGKTEEVQNGFLERLAANGLHVLHSSVDILKEEIPCTACQ